MSNRVSACVSRWLLARCVDGRVCSGCVGFCPKQLQDPIYPPVRGLHRLGDVDMANALRISVDDVRKLKNSVNSYVQGV